MSFKEKRREAFKVPKIPKYFQYLSQPFVGGDVCVELQVKSGGARRSGDYQIVYKDMC